MPLHVGEGKGMKEGRPVGLTCVKSVGEEAISLLTLKALQEIWDELCALLLQF